MTKTAPAADPASPAEIEAFLAERHGAAVRDLESLKGGFWSSAFGYRVGDRHLVIRLGTMRDGFDMDRAAMAFGGPDVPVPVVVEIGEAFGAYYAISERHYGRFLETVTPNEANTAGPGLIRMLRGLRSIPAAPDAPSSWYPPTGQEATTWRGWLLGGLVDDPKRTVSGWRPKLAANADVDRLFRACERRVDELLDACPERRDVVHGDLLHSNVLVTEDASRVSAVFSWKCSARGDFLFDAAWCTFWANWHPGIAAIDVFGRVVTDASAPTGADRDALVDAAIRHHCYEIRIGAGHLGWHAWTGDDKELRAVAATTAMILERGPLPMPVTPSGARAAGTPSG